MNEITELDKAIEEVEKDRAMCCGDIYNDYEMANVTVGDLDKVISAAKHQSQLDKLGIKTLDAKWLDPACHNGCQSLAFAKLLKDGPALLTTCWNVFLPEIEKTFTHKVNLNAVMLERDELQTKSALQHQLLRSVFYAAEFYPQDDGYRLRKVLCCSDNGKQILQELDVRDQLRADLKQCAEALKSSKNQLQNILDYHALQYAPDESKLVAEIKEINQTLSLPSVQQALKEGKE